MSTANKFPTHILCPETGRVRWTDGKMRQTREFRTYWSMRSRCRNGGSYQKREPTYCGATISENFYDFQFFADWCNSATGWHDLDEKGKRFSLDKDILVHGNMEYSEDKCVFVPQRINTLFTGFGSRGVPAQISPSGRYYGHSYTLDGKSIHVGTFDTVEEATAAVMAHRAGVVRRLADMWLGRIDSRVIEIMEAKAKVMEAANVPQP